MIPTTETPPLLEFAIAAQTLAGEDVSGDRYLVKPYPQGTLVAVVDGLGHGSHAAESAAITLGVLERYAGEAIPFLISRCHEALRRTRGATMSLASFDASGTMSWLGVGNVAGTVIRPMGAAGGRVDSLRTRPGVIGARLPSLKPQRVPVGPGDILFFVTDGIRSGFAEALHEGVPPQRLADLILRRFSRGTDDALVFVARRL